MSLKEYITVREYIVTANSTDDLEDLYYELETDNVAPPNTELIRPIRLAEKRPVSRNTHYWLTDWEAEQLKQDPRIRVVEIHPRYRGVSAGTTVTQTSNNWNKSSSTSSTMKNFALLRCTEGVQRAGWGSNGTTTQSGTITLNATGKNVDVVVVDDNGLVWNHPEYAVNDDGTGGTRTIQYNWGQHDPEVKGTPASTYSYGTGTHSTHVAGTVAGNTQGWARDSNIYNIYYYAGAIGDSNFPYVMDYVREFHRTKVNNVSTGRKNPTITNNSWGMSIFPSEWSFSDITAVTYRGTRFIPSGEPTANGISGVFTASTKLADLAGVINAGNRIITSGSTVDPSTRLLSKPSSWIQDGGQTYLNYVNSNDPDPLYTVTVQGPCLVEVRNNIASGGFNGTTTLTLGVEILQGASSIANFSQGPLSGGDVELIIDEIVTLPDSAVYTIKFTSTLNNDTVENPITAVNMSTSITVTGGTASATVTSIANTLGSTVGLTVSTTPSNGNNDDGYWQLPLPFSITYCGEIYNEIYVGSNFYLTFGGGSTLYSGLGPGTPGYPKIMLTSADTSVQRIYYGTSGASPDRTFRVRIEGHFNYFGGVLGSPTMIAEYTFYENLASRIDLQVGVNGQVRSSGSFTTTQLNAWGFIAGQRIPARVAALDADIENAQEEGILYVGAAGNGRWKHDLPGGLDWDNTFEMSNRYPGQVYYYMRGTSPTANDSIAAGGNFNLNTICVGAVDVTSVETQSTFSDCGPGVDLLAPGTAIISSVPSGTADPRNSSFYLGKLSGTSMASPQVCGVLACALEIYPNMTPATAKNYILTYAKRNQLTNNGGGPTDTTDLQGGANLYLYYPQERPTTGSVFPKKNYQFRPTSGNVYPRPKIRAKG